MPERAQCAKHLAQGREHTIKRRGTNNHMEWEMAQWFYNKNSRTWHIRRAENEQSMCGHLRVNPNTEYELQPGVGVHCRACQASMASADARFKRKVAAARA